MPRRNGLGSLPRPTLQPGAGYAILWMLFVAELMQYGPQRELTAAAPDCTCPYVGQTWHDGPKIWEYHQEPDPDCPRHPGIVDWADDGTKIVYHDTPPWARPQPCLCRYGLRPVDGIVGMFQLDPWDDYRRYKGVWAFRIHPRCPHHGDPATAEAAHWTVLDEQERGDH